MTGFEPLISSAVSGLAVPIFQSLLSSGSKVLGIAGKSLDENAKKLIFNVSHQYEKKYRKRHGQIKVLQRYMKKPIQLESIYANVQFLDKDNIWRFDSIENLEEVYRRNNKRSFQAKDCQKTPGEEVANQEQFLMVLGSPGMGKSTFLRKMGLEALTSKLQYEAIPVFIELKNLESGKINIQNIITNEFDTCGFPDVEKFTATALEQGKLLILFDGLDEVPTNATNEAITKIEDFVDKYDKNRFIASCRIAAYHSSFRRFTDVAMAEFDDTQIQQFLNNWFQSELDQQAGTAEKCWQVLQNPEYAAAKELAQTPLLLTLACLVYGYSQSFPKNRAALYEEALDILLKEWAAEKLIQRDPIYQDLNPALEKAMLADIAYMGFKDNRLFFTERELVEKIKTFLEKNLNAPKHLDGEQILKAIELQQGILVERAKDAYSFSHLTFQEYLTAQYIDDYRLIPELVTNHVTDERWQEVFLLVAGLVRGGVAELLVEMEKAAQQLILNSPKLSVWLEWAYTATDSTDGDIKPVGKRALAIAIANAYAIAKANPITILKANFVAIAIFTAIVKAYAYANAIANAYTIAKANPIAVANANGNDVCEKISNAINTTNLLEKLKVFKYVDYSHLIANLERLKNSVPNAREPKAVHKAFANELGETIINAFNVDLQMLELSKDEAAALENYLYINYLMLQCKESAVRGPRSVWEGIESRMLMPPNP